MVHEHRGKLFSIISRPVDTPVIFGALPVGVSLCNWSPRAAYTGSVLLLLPSISGGVCRCVTSLLVISCSCRSTLA